MTKGASLVISKVVVAVVLIVGLIFYAAHSANPNLETAAFFVVVISVLAVLFAFLFMYVSIGSAFNQWMLNNGATDTDWLWFKSDPKGLEDLRKKANEAA